MKSAGILAFVLITGCSALENSQYGEQYPPSPPPDPTEAILAGEKASTQPAQPPRVLQVSFPDKDRRPVDAVETTVGDEEEFAE